MSLLPVETCFTDNSPWELLGHVAKQVKEFAVQHNDPKRSRKAGTKITPAVRRAPGLSSALRVHSMPSPPRALLTFRQVASDVEAELWDLSQRIPALEPPLREHYVDDTAWLGACNAHAEAWNAWFAAHQDDPMEAHHRACERAAQLNAMRAQPSKAFTVSIRIDAEAQRLPKEVIKGLRASETWRFHPDRRSPLEEGLEKSQKAIERLRQRGKLEEAAALEVSGQRLIERMEELPEALKRPRRERQPWGWKLLWIDPGRISTADIQFLLMLYLWQEQMIAWSDDLWAFLHQSIRPLIWENHEEIGQTVDPDQPGALGGDPLAAVILEVFERLRQHYALPEHGLGLWKYMRRVVHEIQKRRGLKTVAMRTSKADERETDEMERAEGVQIRKQRGLGHTKLDNRPVEPLYSVDGAISRVVSEQHSVGGDGSIVENFVVSRDTVYDWIKSGKVQSIQDARGRIRLDRACLEEVRTKIYEKYRREQLIEGALAAGMSHAAIKKALQRGRKAGKTWDEIEARIKRNAANRQRGPAGAPKADEEEEARAVEAVKAMRMELEEGLENVSNDDAWLDILDRLQQLDEWLEAKGYSRREK